MGFEHSGLTIEHSLPQRLPLRQHFIYTNVNFLLYISWIKYIYYISNIYFIFK
jgi:hypothetical protein